MDRHTIFIQAKQGMWYMGLNKLYTTPYVQIQNTIFNKKKGKVNKVIYFTKIWICNKRGV